MLSVTGLEVVQEVWQSAKVVCTQRRLVIRGLSHPALSLSFLPPLPTPPHPSSLPPSSGTLCESQKHISCFDAMCKIRSETADYGPHTFRKNIRLRRKTRRLLLSVRRGAVLHGLVGGCEVSDVQPLPTQLPRAKLDPLGPGRGLGKVLRAAIRRERHRVQPDL